MISRYTGMSRMQLLSNSSAEGIRMAGLYLVGAWLLTQVAGSVLPMFGARFELRFAALIAKMDFANERHSILL